MHFNPLRPPFPPYYKEWYEQRAKRTIKVCETQDVIEGTQIREELLSLKIIMNNGFKLNTRFDRMEKNGE